ncbi:MAG: PhoU domain-containing protein [Planctomycetota bacterium]|nr:PhoU domain-containing protein [Planctomycetota bacterium]
MSEFDARIARLKAELAAQGVAVRRMIESAVDAVFLGDGGQARQTMECDGAIDREDVRIEREAVRLLQEATSAGAELSPDGVRLVLTIVKINNELERVADCAVLIASKHAGFKDGAEPPPPRFRVMANSVIGIMDTATKAYDQMDRVAAELVLASDDATEAFKQALLRETLDHLARGGSTPGRTLDLQIIAATLGRMADHCTNIAEQVIYASTGKVVRNQGDRWSKPEEIA